MTLLNRDFKNKNIFKILYIFIISFFMSFSCVPVFAEGESDDPSSHSGTSHSSETMEQYLTWILNTELNVLSKREFVTAGYPYVRFRYGMTSDINSYALATGTESMAGFPVFAVVWRSLNSDGNSYGNWQTLYFTYEQPPSNFVICYDYSADTLNWRRLGTSGLSLNQHYQYENGDTLGRFIYYANRTYAEPQSSTSLAGYDGPNMPDNCPRINLNYRQDEKTILAVFSSRDFSNIPWTFSTSSGGIHFSSGVDLSPENSSEYSQIYQVMDSNHDNIVSNAEVYYYNATYNTNYDFSQINSGNDFSQLAFLEWVATEINSGNESPGGGSGESGGGSGAVGGGAYIENSGNITINNNNNLNQESLQYLNNIINNDASTDTDESVQSLLGDMRDMLDLVDGFKGLAATVFFFLPGAIKKLISVLFSAIIVLAIFRLIHLIV